MNDQNWVNINVFKEYFNRRVKFKPGLQPNSLYYEIENNVIFQGDLANMKIGEELKWNREVTTTTTIKNTPCVYRLLPKAVNWQGGYRDKENGRRKKNQI